MNKYLLGVLMVVVLQLAACTNMTAVSLDRVPTVVTAPPARIQAVGHGAQSSYGQYSSGQAKLMAMRAAQVDAYRALAEQVYGYRISGSSSVSSFITQNDAVRTYVEAFMRGTRLVSNVSIGDGNFEATVEIDLPVTFLNCVSRYGQAKPDVADCRIPVPAQSFASSM